MALRPEVDQSARQPPRRADDGADRVRRRGDRGAGGGVGEHRRRRHHTRFLSTVTVGPARVVGRVLRIRTADHRGAGRCDRRRRRPQARVHLDRVATRGSTGERVAGVVCDGVGSSGRLECMTAGIVSWGVYLPFWRLKRSDIGLSLGTPAGRGARRVASYDEDTTTMGVEASRRALAALDGDRPEDLLVLHPGPGATSTRPTPPRSMPPSISRSGPGPTTSSARFDRASRHFGPQPGWPSDAGRWP